MPTAWRLSRYEEQSVNAVETALVSAQGMDEYNLSVQVVGEDEERDWAVDKSPCRLCAKWAEGSAGTPPSILCSSLPPCRIVGA